MNYIYNIILISLITLTGTILIINKIIHFFIYKKKKIYLYKVSKEIFITLLIIFIFRSFIYEPFQIPSASMMPTLLIGDLILVNKFKYNILNPITFNSIINTWKPEYGDIIVFRYPKNKKLNYIKRVVGLPNDKIYYNENTKEIKIYHPCLNNKTEYCYQNNIFKYSKKQNSNFLEEIKINQDNIEEYFWNINENIYSKFINSKFLFLKEKTEFIKNKKHKILFLSNKDNFFKKNNFKKENIWIIPKDTYFVLGDYRDNSEDSRYWGFVHKNLIIGKAEYIWMSFEKQENNWPTGFRFKRIGKIY